MKSLTFLLLLLHASLLSIPGVHGDEPAAPAELRIFSYNIKHGRGMDGKVDLPRIAAVIAKSNPDLVALQEIDKNCARSGNQDIAAELGKLLKMEHRFAKFMDFDGGEYGLAVLSRLPIKKATRHPLPLGAEPRCALEVSVQAENWPSPLSFVCIHNDWTKEEIRVRQVSALISALGDVSTPTILAGDFNGTRDDASLKLLQKDHWTIMKKRGPAQTFPSGKPRTEIDFFITRKLPNIRFDHEVIVEALASDHRPIAATINFPNQ